MANLRGAYAGLSDIHMLYRCHDRLLEHKRAVFDPLVDRWRDLFHVSLHSGRARQGRPSPWRRAALGSDQSTYFECELPQAKDAKRRFGHSRDRRSDCVQVVIALVVTVIEKFAAVQMLDVHIPTTDGRELIRTRLSPSSRCCCKNSGSICPPNPHPRSLPAQFSATAL